MSGFKDMVSADRLGVFIDVEFFGVEAKVEGKNILIVLDNNELKNRQGGQDLAVAESSTQEQRTCQNVERQEKVSISTGESVL